MLKLVFHRFGALVITFLLTLVISVISMMLASPAQAGKAMKALAFDQTSGTIEVAEIYETSYAAQKSLIKSLKISSKSMKKAPGFKGALTLQSQDSKQVIALSQWQDLASYQAYTPPAATSEATVSPPSPSRTLKFEVTAIQTAVAGATPALRGKEAVARLTQFTAKSPAVQSQLLASVEEMMPAVLQKQPIPQSVLLLQEVDHGDVALLTNWNCSALFEDVGKPTLIEPDDELVTLADSEQLLYNVLNIIPAEAKKSKEAKLDD